MRNYLFDIYHEDMQTVSCKGCGDPVTPVEDYVPHLCPSCGATHAHLGRTVGNSFMLQWEIDPA